MKEIIYSVLMMATMAFTLTSCEDVPLPYGWPFANGGGDEPTEVPVDAQGTGTVDDPYNVAAALHLISTLGADVNSDNVYTKGIITSISEVSPSYGNASFKISDTADADNELTIYRAKYLDNKGFSSEDQIKIGDEVVIYGQLVNFRGSTPEYTQGCYIYSLNGSGGGSDTPGEAKGTGTLDDPFNAVAANNYASSLASGAESDHDVYIKGKVASIKEQFSTQYGNASFYISDDGTDANTFYVFRTLYLNNEKYTSGDLLKQGDEVVICGRVTNYMGNTPETAANKSYIYSLNSSGGGDTPAPSGDAKGDGTEANPTTLWRPTTLPAHCLRAARAKRYMWRASSLPSRRCRPTTATLPIISLTTARPTTSSTCSAVSTSTARTSPRPIRSRWATRCC